MIEAILLGLFWKKVQIAFIACMVVISSILSVYTMVSMDDNHEVIKGIIGVYNLLLFVLFGIIGRIFSINLNAGNISVNN